MRAVFEATKWDRLGSDHACVWKAESGPASLACVCDVAAPFFDVSMTSKDSRGMRSYDCGGGGRRVGAL